MSMASVAPSTAALAPSLVHSVDDKQRARASSNNPGWLRDRLRARRRHTASDYAVQFTFTHRTVRYLWSLILIVQLLNGLQLLGFSYIYISSHEASLLLYLSVAFLQSPQQTFLAHNGVCIGALYACLGILFLLATLSMVVTTLWHRELRFGVSSTQVLRDMGALLTAKLGVSTVTTDTEATTSPTVEHGAVARERRRQPALLRILGGVVHLVYEHVRVWWVATGVRGQYFEQAMLAREAVELVYQAVQADQVSRRISRKDVNYAYTTLIAVNALLHPLLARVYAQDPPMKRFAVVFADFFLDFIWGCLLPMWMYLPYFQLDRSKSAMQLLFENGFGSIENAQREVEQIVILSWGAFVLSVFPFLSALLSLRSVKKLLTTARRIHSWNDVTAEERTASLILLPSSHNRLPPAQPEPNVVVVAAAATTVATRRITRTGSSRRRTLQQQQQIQQMHAPSSSTLLARCHALLSLGGVIIACIAIASSGVFTRPASGTFRVYDHACKYPLTPWFATRRACAVWYLNCTQMGIQGSATQLDRAFGLVDAKSLVYLSLDSCPHLEMPVSIPQFTNLRALALWSSQLDAWSPQTAITAQNFPALQTVVLEHVTFNDEPRRIRGFITGTWPERVETAIFVDTDVSPLVRVAADAATTWRNVHNWHCVRCRLTKVPTVLFRSASLRELSLEGIAIDSIPPSFNWTLGAPLWPQLKILYLNKDTQLTTISDDVWELLAKGSLQQLWIPATNISSIPSHWIPKLPPTPAIFATDSPLCLNTSGSGNVVIPSLVCDAPYS